MHVQLPCSYRGPIGPYMGAIPGGSSLLRTRPALSREGSRPPGPPGSFPGDLPPPRSPGSFPGGLLPPRNIQDPGIVCENAACRSNARSMVLATQSLR